MKSFKKFLAMVLALVMIISVLPAAAFAAESDEFVYNGTESITYKGITFKRQQGGVYDGIPLFDANPDHLDAYLDVYMDYIGLDGMVRIGLEKRNDYTLVDHYTISDSYADTELAGKTITWENKNAGKVIPGSPQFNESVQGYSTNFPAQIGVGQTWNAALVAQEGRVVGTEKLYGSGSLSYDGSYLSNANQMVSTALTDIRINPLSGRIDESYSEDAYHAATMVNAMAAGVTGHDQAKSDGGFWQMAFVDTKHFTNYQAQWERNNGTFFNSARGLVEYVARSTYKAFSNDHIGCFMTSYGSTNYIPNGMSPMIAYVKSMSSYPISTINDNGAETAPVQRLGNDYMTSYWPRRAEQIISQGLANASAGYQQRTADDQCDDIYATVYAVQTGKLGYTLDDVRINAEGAIINQIRGGILNERDENGNVKNYPFSDIVTGSTVYDYTNKDHQAISLAMGEESAVLLKNNGVLPLSASDDVVLTGEFAESLFATTYAGTIYAGDNMGLTPLGGIMAVTGKTADQLHYTSGAKQIKLKQGDSYLVSDGTLDGTTVTGTADDAAILELYAFGQDDSVGLLETGSSKWIGYSAGGRWNPTPAGLTMSDDAMHLGVRSVNEQRNTVTFSSMPNTMRREYVSGNDGAFRLLANTFTGGFSSAFAQAYYTSGMYLKTAEGGKLDVTEALGSKANAAALRTSATEFTAETVAEAGANVYANGDAAIVVVGAYPRFSSGEGKDRIDLDLGAEQYELAHNVAEKYPGKTVVVVKVSSPVALKELEEDANIGAILYQPYAGEYENLALANLLFGKANPSGHLVNTWYDGNEALPAIDQSIIYNGWANSGVTLDSLDPARDVLMTNGDAYDTGLTYLYDNSDDVVYEFGYGLSYSDFEIRSMKAPRSVSADGTFQVTVEVANLTATPGYAVVQLYIKQNDSPYGDVAPLKQLVAFEKVYVDAVTSTTATLTVDPQDFAVYTADDQDLAVLSGSYTLMAGLSSDLIGQTAGLTVSGEELTALDPTDRVDVFASAFASKDVYYREYNRQSTLDSLKADKVTDGYYAVVSKQSGANVRIANVDLSGLKSFTAEVGAIANGGTIDLRLGSAQGRKIGTITVPVTGSTSYVLRDSGNGDNSDIEITELKFVKAEAVLDDVSGLGTETICFVFNNPELRLASFTAEVETPSESPVVTGFSVSPSVLDSEGGEVTIILTGSDLSDGIAVRINDTVVYTSGTTETQTVTVTLPTNQTAQDAIYTAQYALDGKTFAGSATVTVKGAQGAVIDTPIRPGTVISGSSHNSSELPFTDVSRFDSCYEAVKYLYENDIMNGTSDTKFSPNAELTRGMLVTILYRMEGEPAVGTSGTFRDVASGRYYAKAVEWAAAKNVVKGFTDGTFKPEQPVTREQLAAILSRYASLHGVAVDGAAGDLPADASVSNWAKKDAAWAYAEGILTYAQTMGATKNATRAEVASAIYTYLTETAK